MEKTIEKDEKIPVYVTDEHGTMFLTLAKNQKEKDRIISEYCRSCDSYKVED